MPSVVEDGVEVVGRRCCAVCHPQWPMAPFGEPFILPILKPDPEPTVGPGLGLVGLKPGLESKNGNTEMACKINVSPTFSYKIAMVGYKSNLTASR